MRIMKLKKPISFIYGSCDQDLVPDSIKQYHQPIIFIHNKIDLTNELPSIKIKDGKSMVSLSVKSDKELIY